MVRLDHVKTFLGAASLQVRVWQLRVLCRTTVCLYDYKDREITNPAYQDTNGCG